MKTVFLGTEALQQGTLTEYELRRWHRRIFRRVINEDSGKDIVERARTALLSRGWRPRL